MICKQNPFRFDMKSAGPFIRFLHRSGLPPQLVVLVAVDLFVLLSTALAVFFFRLYYGVFTDTPIYRVLFPLLLLAPVFGVSLGLYRSIALPPHRELKALFAMVSTLYALVLLVLFLTKSGDIFSRMILLGSWGGSLLLLPLGRYCCRRYFSRCWWWSSPLVILGQSRSARNIWHLLRRHPEYGLKPVQILSLSGDSESWVAMLQRVQGRYPNAVGLVLLQLADQRDVEIIRLANQYFRQLLIVPLLYRVFPRYWVTPCDLGSMTGLLLCQNLCDKRRLRVKRFIDLGLCIVALPLILPLGLILSFAIRLDSSGPIFYRQERIGQYGRLLHVFKFRTMQANADEILKECLERDPALKQEWERDFKMKKDPRITRVGHFLRKTSLDELPQLINVIRGEMSVVGPRPIVPSEIGKYGPVYESYCRVKPGITGLWQISGRNNTSYEERVAYDNYYISNWSIWMDIWILGKTVPVVLTGYGAY